MDTGARASTDRAPGSGAFPSRLLDCAEARAPPRLRVACTIRGPLGPQKVTLGGQAGRDIKLAGQIGFRAFDK